MHYDLGTVFKYYIAAEYHSLIGWGIQRYPLGIYLVLYKYTPIKQAQLGHEHKMLTRVSGGLVPSAFTP